MRFTKVNSGRSRSKRTRNHGTATPLGQKRVDDLKKDQHHQALGFSSGEYPSTNTRTSNQNTTTAVSKVSPVSGLFYLKCILIWITGV